MAIQTMVIDPDATFYTDDEIVGKVNAAAANISRLDSVEIAAVLESATEKLMSDVEKTKLAGIEENAKDDQTGIEIRNALLALSDITRGFIRTAPIAGAFKIIAMCRNALGKLHVDYDDEPEP